MFWNHGNLVTNHERTEVPCFMWVRDLGHFLCYCWKNKYVVVCKIHANMCLLDVLTWKLE